MKTEARLADAGLFLPEAAAPDANYIPTARAGNLLFVSGHGPLRDGTFVYVGKVGRDLTLQEGYEAAQLACLNCLASVKASLGNLDRVKRVIKLLGMVNSTPDFGQQPAVINGASDLLVQLYGEAGRHTRSAVGMSALPGGIAVEIEMVLEVED